MNPIRTEEQSVDKFHINLMLSEFRNHNNAALKLVVRQVPKTSLDLISYVKIVPHFSK